MSKEIFNEAFDKTTRLIESVEQIVQMQVCVPDLVLTNCEDEPPPMEVNEQAGVLSSSRELADHHAELGEGADAVVRRVVQRPHARHEGALRRAADQVDRHALLAQRAQHAQVRKAARAAAAQPAPKGGAAERARAMTTTHGDDGKHELPRRLYNAKNIEINELLVVEYYSRKV